MQHKALLQSGAEGPVQAVLEEHLAPVLHHVGEQVAVEGGVLIEQGVEVEGALGRDQLIEPHLPWRQTSPILLPVPVIRVRSPLADALEDHDRSLAAKRV